VIRSNRALAPERSIAGDAKTLDPEAARQRLCDSDRALGLGLTAGQIDALLRYAALLQRWGRVFNLTALRGSDQIVTHHLGDCLAAVPTLRRYAAGRSLAVLDVGSGAGLPGVVLAIAQPSWQVACVDSAAKKASFIRQVAAELGLRNLHVRHARVEVMSGSAEEAGRGAGRHADAPVVARSGFDLVISRAFASLADFVTLSERALADGGVWVAMKGRLPADELATLPPVVEMFHVEQLSVPGLDAQRCLVWVRRRRNPPHA
jgi:16S rRNA (guanine527-N7)-methyltransferase